MKRSLFNNFHHHLPADIGSIPLAVVTAVKFNQKAFDMITSPKARQAFDISKESPAFAKQFDADPWRAPLSGRG